MQSQNRRPRRPDLNLIPGTRPYYARDGITLYRGDVLELLSRVPAAIAAAAITDPPYSSGGLSAGERARDPRQKYCHDGNDCGRPSFGGDTRDQRSFALWATLWMTQLRRIVREAGYCLAFSDWRQRSPLNYTRSIQMPARASWYLTCSWRTPTATYRTSKLIVRQRL